MTNVDVQNLYTKFHTPMHVQKHCKVVADFACKLADTLNSKGVPVDRELVEKAALVHDIVRYVDFRQFNPETWGYEVNAEDVAFMKSLREKHSGEHHAVVGARYLREAGFEKIAQVVEAHNFLHILAGFNSWEEKILYYADKRAKHDSIVSLTERLQDGKIRNAPHLLNDPESVKVDEKVFALEKEIFSLIGKDPSRVS